MAVVYQPPCGVSTVPGTVITVKTETGTIIRAAREALGMSQEDLAYLVGVSQRTVSDTERGVISGARVGTIERYAEALAIDPNVLLAAMNEDQAPRRSRIHFARVTREENNERRRKIIQMVNRIQWDADRFGTIETLLSDMVTEEEERNRMVHGKR